MSFNSDILKEAEAYENKENNKTQNILKNPFSVIINPVNQEPTVKRNEYVNPLTKKGELKKRKKYLSFLQESMKKSPKFLSKSQKQLEQYKKIISEN